MNKNLQNHVDEGKLGELRPTNTPMCLPDRSLTGTQPDASESITVKKGNIIDLPPELLETLKDVLKQFGIDVSENDRGVGRG